MVEFFKKIGKKFKSIDVGIKKMVKYLKAADPFLKIATVSSPKRALIRF